MAKRKSAISQHIDNLRALDKQFRRFDKIARKTLRGRRDLGKLLVELNKLERAIRIPAFGFQ